MNISDIIADVKEILEASHPKAVLLFGSGARFLLKTQEQEPQDLDILYVGTFTPVLPETYPIPLELHGFASDEIIGIAKSLRYSPKAISRAKMYMRDTWHGTVRSDIAACLLLGPAYHDYGFLQMEDEDDPRDYAAHLVLSGKQWWQSLQTYAQTHRGTLGFIVDKSHGLDRFEP